jgi:transcriptional regulator with XRE-family HTH domain
VTAAAEPGARVVPIDPALVRARRIAVGLGHTTLADMLGVSPMVIDWLEHGSDQKHFTIGFLVDLAHTLGCGPADLLVDRPTPVPDTGPDDVADTDPATAGRNLAVAGRVHVDELARALDWTSGRVRRALHLLEDRLDATGQVLAWVADTEVQITAAPGPTVVAETAGRRSLQSRGMQENDARLFHQLLTKGPAASSARLDVMALNRLTSAGLVTTEIEERTDRNRPATKREAARLTDTAHYNLYLDAQHLGSAAHQT